MKPLKIDDLAQHLRQQRKQKQWTQVDLMQQSGVLQKTISKIERNPGSSQLDSVFKLLEALEIELYLSSQGTDHTLEQEISLDDDGRGQGGSGQAQNGESQSAQYSREVERSSKPTGHARQHIQDITRIGLMLKGNLSRLSGLLDEEDAEAIELLNSSLSSLRILDQSLLKLRRELKEW